MDLKIIVFFERGRFKKNTVKLFKRITCDGRGWCRYLSAINNSQDCLGIELFVHFKYYHQPCSS